MALKKTGSMKEFDLCAYLSTDDRPFLPSEYLKLRDTDRNTLLNLIKEKILDRDPFKIPLKTQESTTILAYSGQPLDECIKEAKARVNVLKDTALCKYIPCDVEGYLHREAADMLGLSVSASKSRLFRARMRLRGELLR